MHATRRYLRRLNTARAIAASTLLLSAFAIELWFVPEQPLRSLYFLAAGVFAAILVYALLDRWAGDRRWFAGLQIGGDVLLVAGFVLATGGALSPLSFLFALPVMVGAALLGMRGGVLVAAGAGVSWLLILGAGSLRLSPEELPPGRVVYAAVSHLLGFLLLAVLGGVFAERLQEADRELADHRRDLASLRALQQQIVQSIGTGIVTATPEGRATFVNRAGSEILGLPAGEVVGRPVEELLGLPAGFLAAAGAQARAGRRTRFEREWTRTADGERLVLGFSVAPLVDGDGREIGWLLVFQDLTEIASLEEQVRTRERMAALGEMAAGIAHELRNPLAAISGSVQVLREQGAGGELATLIVRETERLNRIIRDFLAFARPGSFRPREVDLGLLMEELARLLRKSPEMGPAHRVEVVVGPGPTTAWADPDRVRQIFWNLASNALRAMPGGGKLEIRVEGHGADRVLVAFRDEGHGMDEETARRFFQPFEGRFRDGAGLGAAIVYRIVQQHGGRVEVSSREGRGTEIRVILPCRSPAAVPGAGEVLPWR